MHNHYGRNTALRHVAVTERPLSTLGPDWVSPVRLALVVRLDGWEVNKGRVLGSNIRDQGHRTLHDTAAA